MSKPSHADLAAALGVEIARVWQLARRGMPINAIDKARSWFARNGFSSQCRAASCAAQSQRSRAGTWKPPPNEKRPEGAAARSGREGGPPDGQTATEDIRTTAARYAVRVILHDGEVVTHSVHRDRRSAERVVNSLRWAGRAARVDELEGAQ